MDIARDALEHADVMEWRVKRPDILTPLFPTSLIAPDAMDVERSIVGPEQEVPWPAGAAWLEYEGLVAAVLGLEAAEVMPEDMGNHVFGYTLVSDWRARDSSGAPVSSAEGVPIAIGPCLVTAEELDPQTMFLQLLLDGEETDKGNLNGAAASLLMLISDVSHDRALARGDALALSPFPGRGRQLWPGATVELGAEGIGTLRNWIASAGA